MLTKLTIRNFKKIGRVEVDSGNAVVTCSIEDLKTVPSETIGASGADRKGWVSVLTVWPFHSHPTVTEEKTHLIPAAVDAEGRWNPELDNLCHLLEAIINSMLHWELQHRRITAYDGDDAVEFIS